MRTNVASIAAHSVRTRGKREGEWIKNLRNNRLQMSQEAFARLLEVSVATVSRWEREAVTPDTYLDAKLRRLERVAEKLGESMPGERLAKWLQGPNPDLKGLPPVDLLGSEYGARKLDDMIEQLMHGVPA